MKGKLYGAEIRIYLHDLITCKTSLAASRLISAVWQVSSTPPTACAAIQLPHTESTSTLVNIVAGPEANCGRGPHVAGVERGPLTGSVRAVLRRAGSRPATRSCTGRRRGTLPLSDRLQLLLSNLVGSDALSPHACLLPLYYLDLCLNFAGRHLLDLRPYLFQVFFAVDRLHRKKTANPCASFL